MKVHPVYSQLNGIITVTLQAQFVGDSTDPSDKTKIAAYGDPQVNLGGTYTDPSNTGFTFSMPATELYVGITTQMQGYPARFMKNVPPVAPTAYPGQVSAHLSGYQPAQCQPGSLDCVTTNPTEAATVWVAAVTAAIVAAMTALRAQAALPTLSDTTV